MTDEELRNKAERCYEDNYPNGVDELGDALLNTPNEMIDFALMFNDVMSPKHVCPYCNNSGRILTK